MKKINWNFLYPLLCLLIIIYALSNNIFQIPPLGKVLNPFIGAIQNENENNLNSRLLIKPKLGLADTVKVYFDKRKVPHIYARNQHDLYFAQGYVTAHLRLWQMDFLSYTSAGRLSEIFADGYLDYDRTQRRLGILNGAKETLKLIEKDKETIDALNNYTSGVNAYIKELTYKTMPLEYKLFNYQPELWSNLKSILIMKYIGNTLAGYEQDLPMTNLMLVLGEKKFNKYFPSFSSTTAPLINYLSNKSNSSLIFTKKPDYLDYSFLSAVSSLDSNNYNPRFGSNSWVVSGKKTKNGFPILCSDPHLGLSLPSIWVEMQLSSPEENVYGVSIPGTPAVIIGFNNHIAWGLTNGQQDVKDWYKLKLSPDGKKYLFDGKWLNLTSKIERIDRRGQKSYLDTVNYTVHGPVLQDKRFTSKKAEVINFALQWQMNKPSNEFKCFIRLNKAKNLSEYKTAIANYTFPSQNFIFACEDNTIAANHQGKLHVKWNGQGRFILDGTQKSHMYTKYIPQDSLPQVINPDCNYIVSANQHPTLTNYPYYYNGYFIENRAIRIEELLKYDDKLDAKKMMKIQLDNTSVFAREAIKVLLNRLEAVPDNDYSRKILKELKSWNGTYDLNSTGAPFFDAWWMNIKMNTWDEFANYNFHMIPPSDDVLLGLIKKEPNDNYFDLLTTNKHESADDIVRLSYEQAINYFRKLNKTDLVKWGDFHKVSVEHMGRIAPFGKLNMPSDGSPEAINAMGNNWGPSWRMVVELGKRPKAYGIFAGGQSGNEGGSYYNNSIDDWKDGKYNALLYYMSEKEAEAGTRNSWILK